MAIRSVSLDQFLGRATPHQTIPTAIKTPLRVSAWAALGVDALFLMWLWFGWDEIALATEKNGLFLVGWGVLQDLVVFGGHGPFLLQATLVVLGSGLMLAVWSRGFQMAPPWAHLATAALALTGLPAAVLLLMVLGLVLVNLALWAAIIALVIGFCIATLAALFDSL